MQKEKQIQNEFSVKQLNVKNNKFTHILQNFNFFSMVLASTERLKPNPNLEYYKREGFPCLTTLKLNPNSTSILTTIKKKR